MRLPVQTVLSTLPATRLLSASLATRAARQRWMQSSRCGTHPDQPGEACRSPKRSFSAIPGGFEAHGAPNGPSRATPSSQRSISAPPLPGTWSIPGAAETQIACHNLETSLGKIDGVVERQLVEGELVCTLQAHKELSSI